MQWNEDWLATVIGLSMVAVVGLGIVGPGPQTVQVTAAPGEANSRPIWEGGAPTLSAQLGDESVAIGGSAENWAFVCQDGGVQHVQSAVYNALVGQQNPLPGGTVTERVTTTVVSVSVANDCDQDVTVTYKTNAAIRWPLMNLFGRQGGN
jgi:hypothetical protein